MGQVVIWFIFVLFSLILASAAQYAYAREGYPHSWRWRILLFLTGALWTFTILLAFRSYIFGILETTPMTNALLIVCVCVFGAGMAWILPYKLRWVIPKQTKK